MSPRFTLERVGFGLRKAIEKSTLFKISGASLTLAPGVGRLVQFLGSKPQSTEGMSVAAW